MSMLKIFAVKDTKAEAFMKPFFMRTRGEAIRGFTEASNDDKTQFCKYPADFYLFEVGEFNEFTGMLSALDAPVNVGCALDFKEIK